AGGARHQLLPDLLRAGPADGPAGRLQRARQPVERRRVAGGAEPESDVWAAGGRGKQGSRWLETPSHVRERAGDLPAGFRAAGVAAGLKPSGARDVALRVSDSPDTVSAARFTRSGVLAAPVILCQKRVRLDAIRAVVVNSGNANAATGNRGLEDAAR